MTGNVKKKRKKKKKTRKLIKFIATLSIITALLLTGSYFALDHFKFELLDYFVKKIEKNSGGLYSIKYEKIDLDLFNKSVHIKNFSLHLNRKVLKKIENESLKTRLLVKTTRPISNLKIEGISIFALIFNKSLGIKRLFLENGEVVIVKIKKNTKIKKGHRYKKNGTAVPIKGKKKSKPLRSIYIKNLRTVKTAFKLIEVGKRDPLLTIPEVSLLFSKFKIYLGGKLKGTFTFKTGKSGLKELCFVLPRGFYTLRAKGLKVSKSRSKSFISIHSLRLTPRYKTYQFSRIKGYRTDRLSLKIRNITVEDIDFNGLFKHRHFSCKLLTLTNPGLDIFRNKNMPKHPRPKKKKFPQQLLRDFKYKVKIDNIKIFNGHIAYTEHAKTAEKAGKIFFTEIEANINNITNYPELSEKKVTARLTISAKLMGKSRLRTKFTMPVSSKRDSFTVSGSLDKMDMRALNPILEHNAHIKVKKGTVNKLYFSVWADRSRAAGKMQFFYKNLKVSVFKKSGKRKKRKFFSFLANAVIYRDNPSRRKPLRVGEIYFQREKPLSFFTYLWKSLLTGIKSSVIGLKKFRKRKK